MLGRAHALFEIHTQQQADHTLKREILISINKYLHTKTFIKNTAQGYYLVFQIRIGILSSQYLCK